MAIEATDGIKNVNPKPEIRRFFNNAGEPYTNVSQVLSQVDQDIRYRGQEFFLESGEIYYFLHGTQDNQLIRKKVPLDYDVIAMDTFLTNPEQSPQNQSGNLMVANGIMEIIILPGSTAYLEYNMGVGGCPSGAVGVVTLDAGSNDDPGSLGIAMSDGGAGLFDGSYAGRWNESIGIIVRCAVSQLQSETHQYNFAVGGFDTIDQVYSGGVGIPAACIRYGAGSPNWIIEHSSSVDLVSLDSGVPVVANQWYNLRVDVLASGYVNYYIDDVLISQLSIFSLIQLGTRITMVSGEPAETGRAHIDEIKIIKF